MKKQMVTKKTIYSFEKHLKENEKSTLTIAKYLREIILFMEYLSEEPISKIKLLLYRDKLLEENQAQTVNTKLSAVNSYLDFCGCPECKVKLLKVQRQAFLDETRELTEGEYRRLLAAARNKGNERLYLLMLTVCGTGIRISELMYITVEAAKAGRAEIRMKGKNRTIILQKKLRNKLLQYAQRHKIENGHIFRTKSGKPMDRSNICHDMKKLCTAAKVSPCKAFPHNLRHLFARTFYAIERNLAHLADVLGHSRIETTRIYVAVSVAAHERILNRMKLVV
jgi:integrase/recombinase XerD